tara:strand:+ start:4129 stop:4332 length:204 start_codon:yes stop_codon:yes gene_type:complete
MTFVVKEEKEENMDKARLLSMCLSRRLLVDKIKSWLRKELNDNTEGYTRQECASQLYEKIIEWEKEL